MMRRLIAAGTVLALAGCGLAGCGGDGEAEGKDLAPITVAFGGDVNFQDGLAARLSDPSSALGPISQQLGAADLTMVNLETAITEGGTPAAKQFTFRAPSTAFDALKAAGVDVVTMANNHGMDYGPEGLQDSLNAAKEKGFPVVGIGANAAEAFTPHVADVKGTKVAVFGATQVLDDNLISAWTATDSQAGLASAKEPARLIEAVKKAKDEYDTVIVNLHWGVEKQSCPSDDQKALADQLVDAGADAVVGSHAHVLQAGGFHAQKKDKYIHYGLGNFVFYSFTPGSPTSQSGVLTLTLKGHKVQKADWAPAVLESPGLPRPLNGTEAQSAYTAWQALNGCAGLAQ
ncbi:CapA family protein [Actinocorallia sp. B10E7]|uniref:CapA family protein n=1 Tax=Actinocorallia sp. B10E7 TaxID=3153558 RepID=UPI00325ED50E